MSDSVFEQAPEYLSILNSIAFLGEPAIGLYPIPAEFPTTSQALTIVLKQNNLLIAQIIKLQQKVNILTEKVNTLLVKQDDANLNASLDLITQKINNLKITDSENVIKPSKRLLYVYKKPSSSKGKEASSS